MIAPSLLLSLLADAGVPMIMLTYPAMLALLVPIIAIEAYLCKRWLHLTLGEAVRSTGIANVISTIVGIPLAWLVMFLLELGVLLPVLKSHVLERVHSPVVTVIVFFFSSAWIGPPERMKWLIPCAVLALFLPFYFASYGIEYLIVRRLLKQSGDTSTGLDRRRIRRAVRDANLVTYGLMLVGTTVWLIAEIPWR